jgi:hypothetical protein
MEKDLSKNMEILAFIILNQLIVCFHVFFYIFSNLLLSADS